MSSSVPNASGKSNFIEVLGLLNALPTDFGAAIRDGGGAAEWVWKGSPQPGFATIEVETGPRYGTQPAAEVSSFLRHDRSSGQYHRRSSGGDTLSTGFLAILLLYVPAGSTGDQYTCADTRRTENGQNAPMGPAFLGPVRSCAAQGPGSLSGALLARDDLRDDTVISGVDVRSLR